MSENREVTYIGGMFGKMPKEDDKGFVVGRMSIKKADLIAFIEKQDPDDEWMNVDILQRKSDPTKLNFQLNTWKPKKKDGEESDTGSENYDVDEDENLPF